MSLENESTQELTDERMDELVEGIDKPTNREIPMTDPEAGKPAAPAEEKMIEFTHEGKPIKAKMDQLIKWAQQGYNYPQKMQQFNQQRQQWEQQRSKWEQAYSPYQKIDQWAKQNPTQWQQLQQLWQQQASGQAMPGAQHQPGAAQDPRYSVLEQKLGQLEQIVPLVQEFASERERAKVAQEDQALESEIKSIQEKYPDLDLKAIDDSGYSLEYRVLEHAQKNGIGSFRAAFNDYNHDTLLTRERTLAQQSVSKGIQARTKLGILGESPTPRTGVRQATDIRKQSYEELMREGLEELKSGRSTA